MSDRSAPVRTPRLLLRCFAVDDAPALKQAVDESLDHLRPWMEWAAREPTPLPGVEARLARYARDFEEDADWVYAMFDAGGARLLGVVGVHVRPGAGAREIGYWLRAEHEGQGYMSEAVNALTRAAFERHGARRVEIRCDPRNSRSAAVARRAGYAHETTLLANALTPAGEPRDTMLWAVTAPPPRVRAVLETCLYAADLQAAERFYVDVLGLEVLGRVPGRHVFFRLGRGVFLVFEPDATSVAPAHGIRVPTHGAHGAGHVAFAVPDAELDGWRDRLARLGVAVEAEVAWPRGGRSLYVRDPAGNSVELAAPAIWGLPDEVAGADPAPTTGHSPGTEP